MQRYTSTVIQYEYMTMPSSRNAGNMQSMTSKTLQLQTLLF